MSLVSLLVLLLAMKKRIRNKILKRFLDADYLLCRMFAMGGTKNYRNEIGWIRATIRYYRLRYPRIYSLAFESDWDPKDRGEGDIGHWDAGR